MTATTNSVITAGYISKKRQAMQYGNAMPQITHVAFGGGGHEADGTARYPKASETALTEEYLRKAVTQIYNESTDSITVIGELGEYELPDHEISEAALFDDDGDMVAVMCFEKRKKEAGSPDVARFKIFA